VLRSFSGQAIQFLTIAIVVLACESGSESLKPDDATFFPVKVGSFFVYSVAETQYSQSSHVDISYELKVAVTDSFPNVEGGYEYVLQRSAKSEGEIQWIYMDTWAVRVNSLQVIVKEGATSFIKLTFPVSEGKLWNGNALNNMGGDQVCGNDPCDLYEMINLNKSFATEFATYNETIRVVQSDTEDAIVGNNVRIEIYARNVGLVYKEHNVVEYCTVGDCIGQKQIIDGYVLKQQLTDHGIE
jgi:hypothetical protein